MLFRVQRPVVHEQTNHFSTGRLERRSPTASERDAPVHHEVGWMRSDADDGAIFDILADGRRRRVVRALADAPERTLDLDRLVDRVARLTNDGGEHDEGELRERDRIALRLHHADLPKLSDAGVLDYDPDEGTVRILTGATLVGWDAARDALSTSRS